MGWLKKITRPISKVLDKIIPNEIKPALPYLSAFAPFMMGPQSGIMGSSMLRRALMSGAFNLGSQLSQEGSEGEFSGLSALLAAGTGAMTSPEAPGFFKGMQGTEAPGISTSPHELLGPQYGPHSYVVPTPEMGTMVPMEGAIAPVESGIMESIKSGIGKGGERVSEFLIDAGKRIRPGEGLEMGLDKETLGALAVPASQGTADLALAEAQRALRDYEDQMAVDESMSLIDDDGRRRAIRAAMEASNHLESTILDTLAALGLKEGGMVGLKHGGVLNAKRGLVDGPGGYAGYDLEGLSLSQLEDLVNLGVIDSSEYELRLRDLGVIKKEGGMVGLKHGGQLVKRGAGRPGYAGETYDSRATPGEFRKALENVSGGSVAQQEKDLQDFTQNFLAEQTKRTGNIGGLGGLYLKDRGGYTLTGGSEAKPNFSNIYAGYANRGLNKDQIRGQAITDTFSLSGPYSDPFLTPGTAGPYSWESMVQNKAQADYIAELLGSGMKQGGVASVLPKGKEADYRGGGVIPVGSRERADDVPARLSKNEFVMTADAVRAAGGGNINKGAKRMYNLMHNLEARV